MDDYLVNALEIVKAQAGVRTMTEEEIASMVASLAKSLRGIAEGNGEVSVSSPSLELDPKKAIKEKSITCLECGKSFKILTKRHLAVHGLTPDEYRAKYGYKKGAALVAKWLARERSQKMKDMKLWDRRKQN